METNGLKLIVA